VINISSGLSPGHAKSYYTRELAAPENRLFTELESGQVRHHGAVAIHLGLSDPRSHTAMTFRNLCDGRTPDGAEVLVAARRGWEASAIRQARRANARNAGWDVNVSPHKSVSVAALVLGDERIVEAHRVAVRELLLRIEPTICTRTTDGRGAERTGALLATTFDHAVSRELDPQLHTHVFVHNITVDRTGRTRAVYIAPTFGAREQIAEAYDENLAESLTAIGYRIFRDPRTRAVAIDGFPSPLLDHFSTRARQVRRKVEEIRAEARSRSERREPTARTLHRWSAQASRRRKPDHVDWRELRTRWVEQVRELGLDPANLLSAAQRLGMALPREPSRSSGRRGVERAELAPDERAETVGRSIPPGGEAAPPSEGRGDPSAGRLALFVARDAAEALRESMTGDDEEGLQPLRSVSTAAGHAAAHAVESASDLGFLARLRAAAGRLRGTDCPDPNRPSTAQLPPPAIPAPGNVQPQAPSRSLNGPADRTAAIRPGRGIPLPDLDRGR